MKIYKTASSILIEQEGKWYQSAENKWDQLINRDDLYEQLNKEIAALKPVSEPAGLIAASSLLAPIGSQEVWAAGVTYLRSKVARMEESEESGGATFYDKVYEAERPELFFKSTAQRVVSPGGAVRIRKDSSWDVPEPELTLFVTSSAKIVAYTIGNDMSSRSIEGENPLYLPQAKVYNGSAAIGPCLYVPSEPIPPDTGISISIKRKGEQVFQGSTRIDQMKRSHTELVEFLYREYDFPTGCFLMTGTCIVPGNDFTLQSGDEVEIVIDHIGTLTNTVA
ncbi:MAG: fumarylacetoacetate hydrolase family protein [Williamsia sp.]|nr:fumarylacetoacetate hydrolase family protein [Williamsia sp.]